VSGENRQGVSSVRRLPNLRGYAGNGDSQPIEEWVYYLVADFTSSGGDPIPANSRWTSMSIENMGEVPIEVHAGKLGDDPDLSGNGVVNPGGVLDKDIYSLEDSGGIGQIALKGLIERNGIFGAYYAPSEAEYDLIKYKAKITVEFWRVLA
jgi:hypothetical protein